MAPQDPPFSSLYAAARQSAPTPTSTAPPAWLTGYAAPSASAAPTAQVTDWNKWTDTTPTAMRSRAQALESDPVGTVRAFQSAYRALPEDARQRWADYYVREGSALREMSRKKQIRETVKSNPIGWFAGAGELANIFGAATGLRDSMESAAGGYVAGDWVDVDESGNEVRKPIAPDGKMLWPDALEVALQSHEEMARFGVQLSDKELFDRSRSVALTASIAGGARVLAENVGVAKAFGFAGRAVQGTKLALAAKPLQFLGGEAGGPAARAVGQQIGYGLVSRQAQGVAEYRSRIAERMATLTLQPGETYEDAQARVEGGAFWFGAQKAFDPKQIARDSALGLAFYGMSKVTRNVASRVVPSAVLNAGKTAALDQAARSAMGRGAGLATTAREAGRRAAAAGGARLVEGIATGIDFSVGTKLAEAFEFYALGTGHDPFRAAGLNDPLSVMAGQGIAGFAYGIMFGHSPLTHTRLRTQRPQGAAERLRWYSDRSAQPTKELIDTLTRQNGGSAEKVVPLFDAVFDAATNRERNDAVRSFGERVAAEMQAEFDRAESAYDFERTAEQARTAAGEMRDARDARRDERSAQAQRAQGEADSEYARDALERRSAAERLDRAFGTSAVSGAGVRGTTSVPPRRTLNDVEAQNLNRRFDLDDLWTTAQMVREAGDGSGAARIERAVDILSQTSEPTDAEILELRDLLPEIEAANTPDAQAKLLRAVQKARSAENNESELEELLRQQRAAVASGQDMDPAAAARIDTLRRGKKADGAAVRPRSPYPPRPGRRPYEPRARAAADPGEPQAAAPQRPSQPSARPVEVVPPRRLTAERGLPTAPEEPRRLAPSDVIYARDESPERRLRDMGGPPSRPPGFSGGRRVEASDEAIGGGLRRLEEARRADELDQEAVRRIGELRAERDARRALTTPEQLSTDELAEAESIAREIPGARVEMVDPAALELDVKKAQMRRTTDAQGSASRVGTPYRVSSGGYWIAFRPKEGPLKLVHGHNRRASWMATDPAVRPPKVRAVVVDEARGGKFDDAVFEALMENLRGDTLEPIDAAAAVRQARKLGRIPEGADLKAWLATQGVGANLLSRQKVAAAVDLEKLSPDVFEEVARGALDVPVARELAKLGDRFDSQDDLLRRIRDVESGMDAAGKPVPPRSVGADEVAGWVRALDAARQTSMAVDERELALSGAVERLLGAMDRTLSRAAGKLRGGVRSKAELEAAGSRIDKDAAEAAIAKLRSLIETIEKRGRRTSALSEAVGDAAKKLIAKPDAEDALASDLLVRLNEYDAARDAFADGRNYVGDAPFAEPDDGTGSLFGDAAPPPPPANPTPRPAEIAPQTASEPVSRREIDAVLVGIERAKDVNQAASLVESLPAGPARAEAIGWFETLKADGKWGGRRPKK